MVVRQRFESVVRSTSPLPALVAMVSSALSAPAHAKEIAWHSKSDHSAQNATNSGFNSERNATAVFATGERASIAGYSINYAEVRIR